MYGTFTSADPLHSNATSPANPKDPGSWNRYSYAGGDPVNRVDPTGTENCGINITIDGAPSLLSCMDPCSGVYGIVESSNSPCATSSPGWWSIAAINAAVQAAIAAALQYVTDAQHTTAPPPMCSITLEWRPVEASGPLSLVNHDYSFLTTATTALSGAVALSDDLVEGLPQQYDALNNNWGLITSNVYSNFNVQGDPRDYQDHPFYPGLPNAQLSADGHSNPLVGGASVCSEVGGIEAEAPSLDRKFQYNPWPGLTSPIGENGNWLAWKLLQGNGVMFGNPPASPGWP